MLKKLKITAYFLLALFIIYSIYLSSVLAIKGEVHLGNDIGRDFLLLQELDQKKIVLIGARTNSQGIFHGPLWTYLNYPAYLIGQGNPVAVAWFWVILGIIFLITTFYILQKIFGTLPSLLAVSLLAVDLVPYSNKLFGQISTFYFIPLFLVTIYMYTTTQKSSYLLLHFVTAGILIQMNIGAGLLLALLSVLLSLGFIIKHKLAGHLLTLLILPLMVSNFILFDIRHEFNLSRALLNMSASSKFIIPFNSWIQNRLDYLTSMQIFSPDGHPLAFLVVLLLILFTLLEIKNNSKLKTLYLLLIFYYFGYMLLTYFNKGILLFDHVFPLSALSAIWLASLTKYSWKIIFIPVILFVTYHNFNYANNFLSSTAQTFIGNKPDSWIALKSVAKYIIDLQKGKEFGYFVYSPDSFAYQQRYALSYAFKNAGAASFEYVKKPVTYIIAAPPPDNNPYMKEDWWIKNQAKILVAPALKKHFPGGYIIEKFTLTTAQQKIPHNPEIELGLHFR